MNCSNTMHNTSLTRQLCIRLLNIDNQGLEKLYVRFILDNALKGAKAIKALAFWLYLYYI